MPYWSAATPKGNDIEALVARPPSCIKYDEGPLPAKMEVPLPATVEIVCAQEPGEIKRIANPKRSLYTFKVLRIIFSILYQSEWQPYHQT
ncbi:hypothetical protein [Adhaeribacter aerolatus]|uniref:hypothetical protein n=1 Tax=Adhaeribacter aerolatus TaxID=670289 RepID=UPI001FEA4ABB|nr:hypothetical protein [Adhaeribacter aerolatus]